MIYWMLHFKDLEMKKQYMNTWVFSSHFVFFIRFHESSSEFYLLKQVRGIAHSI